MPCSTSHLLKNLQYLDLSDNLLTDMTLAETLCDGDGTLQGLRVLNVSGNTLKVPSGNSLLDEERSDLQEHEQAQNLLCPFHF